MIKKRFHYFLFQSLKIQCVGPNLRISENVVDTEIKNVSVTKIKSQFKKKLIQETSQFFKIIFH